MLKISDWGLRLHCKLGRPRLQNEVPKGHLAVYVGKKDGEAHRYLVPVIFFNHPLFGELLREAEEEYGFDHAGCITIPCQKAKFERVGSKIAATSHTITGNIISCIS